MAKINLGRVKGEAGTPGRDGLRGLDGAQGIQGVPGPQGVQGERGETGPTGPKGDTGATGPQGPKGEPGSQPPISDSVSSNDSGVAASSKAVKTAYDKAVAAASRAEQAFTSATSPATVATTKAQGVGRVATLADMTGTPANGPAFLATNSTALSTTPKANAIPKAGTSGLSSLWGALPIGKIDLLPWRTNAIPAGWYFCNGARYTNTSPQGIALNALPANFKTDWGITNNGSTTNVPNWFHTDGRGPVMRAVNGTSRQVGTLEEDALQEITGIAQSSTWASVAGAFSMVSIHPGSGIGIGSYDALQADFKASRVSRTSTETRMINRAMTPAIFLGV